MAFAFVQAKTGTTTATFTSTPISGNLLVAYVFNSAAGTPTITNWTALTNFTTGGGSAQSNRMFWKISDGSETGAVTPSTTSSHITIAEYSGGAGASPVDAETAAAASNTGSAYTSSSVTPTSSVERLVVIGIGHRTTANVSSQTINGSSTGVNVRGTPNGTTGALIDLDVTSTSGSYSGVITFSGGTGAGSNSIATFKPSAGLADLTINTSDSITISESVDALRAGARDVNKSDSVTITESIGRMLESNRSISENVTITESQAYSDLLIQFDATSNSGYQAASSSYNWNHTVGNYNNRVLTVEVGLLNVANSVTGITYNNLALTKLRSDVSVSGTVRTEIWYLIAPPVGTFSVAVTLNTASVSGATASSYLGVDQYTPFDAQNGDTGITGAGGGSATVTTNTNVNWDWVIDVIATPDTTITVASVQRGRSNITGAVGSTGQSDQGPKTPNGSVTSQWDNIAGLTSWTMSTAALMPVQPDAVVSDSISVTESVKVELNSFVNKSEAITVTESQQFMMESYVNKSDSITITENLKLLNEENINKSDNITLTENVSLLVPNLYANVSDSVTITESLSLLELSFINTNDAITITESTKLLLGSSILVNDSVTVSEALKLLLEANVNKSDSTSVTENVTASIVSISDLSVNVSDSLTITEAIKLLSEANINKSENIAITENLKQLLISSITVNDSVTVTESLKLLEESFINRNESISITESVVLQESSLPTLVINLSDSITITESLSVSIASTPSGTPRTLTLLGVG